MKTLTGPPTVFVIDDPLGLRLLGGAVERFPSPVRAVIAAAL